MSSEIERLRDLEGFLKFASIPDWRRVALTLPPVSANQQGKRPSAAASAHDFTRSLGRAWGVDTR